MSLLDATLAAITAPNEEVRQRAHARLETITMPHWAMGRLMDLAVDLAAMTGTLQPPVERRTLVIMAADHGVAEEGVSKYPREVTAQMVLNFVRGGAGANAMARVARARVVVADLGVYNGLLPEAVGHVLDYRIANGTANMAHGPAMTREQAVQSLEAGIRIASDLAADTDLYATGEVGIGNTTPSSAIVATLCGCDAATATGRGSGVDDEALRGKIRIIDQALKVNQPDAKDGIDILAKVGGFEIGAIAGMILGAASLRKPIVVDGFISTAAALIAHALAPLSAHYMIASHHSVEPAHVLAMDRLGKRPLLNLGLRLGEGTGAALAMPIVEGAARLLTDVATFDEASVSRS